MKSKKLKHKFCILFFFEALRGEKPALAHAIANKETSELVQSYYAIPKAQRRRLFDMAKVLSVAA